MTYSQCDLTRQDLLESLQARYPVEQYMVAREKHGDDHFHLHCFLKFSKKLDLYDPRCFDVEGYHPYISPSRRSVAGWLEYLCKEDKEVLTNMERNPFAQALTCSTVEDGIRVLRESRPRDVVLYGESIRRNLEREICHVRVEFQSRFEFSSFRTFGEVEEFFRIARDSEQRNKCLFIHGPSRMGKTQFARSFGTHNYFPGMFTLESYRDDVEFNVFDDCDWKFIPSRKPMFADSGDGEAVVTDKYHRKKRVKVHPCIWLCNQLPDFDGEDEYWSLNGIFLYVDTRLY